MLTTQGKKGNLLTGLAHLFFYSRATVFKLGYLPDEGKIFALLGSDRVDTTLISSKKYTLAIRFQLQIG